MLGLSEGMPGNVDKEGDYAWLKREPGQLYQEVKDLFEYAQETRC